MSFGVGLGDLALVFDTCVKIYDKFKEADETINDASLRIIEIRSYMKEVIASLNNKFGSPDKYPKSDYCRTIIGQMEVKAKGVNKIFEQYYKAQTHPNLFGGVYYQTLYAIGSNTHDLQQLINGLERQKSDLSQRLIIFIFDGMPPSPNVPVTQQQLASQNKVKPTMNILFLDSENTGRSVIAQAYAMLVSEWTTRTKHEWRINTIHSAGIDVAYQCGIMDIRGLLEAPLQQGRQLPSLSAQSALFDPPVFNHPYKADIRKKIGGRFSRGLGRSTFLNYDYIIVFTLNHLWAIQKLLQATKKNSPDLVGKKRPRFVVLGEYGKASAGSNIWGPKKGQSDKEKKDYWIKTVANIKVSFKGWLKEELDWKQPPKGTPQS